MQMKAETQVEQVVPAVRGIPATTTMIIMAAVIAMTTMMMIAVPTDTAAPAR